MSTLDDRGNIIDNYPYEAASNYKDNDGVHRESSPLSHEHDASTSDTDSTSSSSYSSSSDSCEDEEWQQDVDCNGELLFVRAAETSLETVAPSRSISPPSSKQNSGKFPVRLRWRNKDSVVQSTGSIDVSCQKINEKSSNRHFLDIFLTLKDKQINLGRRSSQLELLFGIIPGRNQTKINEKITDFVSVRAVQPDSQASRDPNIRIGDVIHKIQDIEVTWSNLAQVLSSLTPSSQSKQVKVTLISSDDLSTNKSTSIIDDENNIVHKKSSAIYSPKLLTDNEDIDLNHQHVHQPHGILYLTLGNSNSTSSVINEDILFQYPLVANKLIPIRGALFTINHIMPELFDSPPLSSSIVIDSQLVHVCYAHDGKEVLLLAVPAQYVTVYHLTELTIQINRLFTFQFKTLHNCFTNVSHHSRLNHFFSLFFLSLISAKKTWTVTPFIDRPIFKCFGVSQMLPISADLQCCISDMLNEFESSDFADLSEDHFEMRRLYDILGTVLFYKGYLVSSHLSPDDLVCINLYLEGNGLLETSRHTLLSQVIAWREVYRNCSPDNGRRWFLLVVGRNHSLLAVLLEAGGCSTKLVGTQGPDPFYVEQCRSTLIQLEVRQIPKSLDSWLDCPSTPALVSAESMSLFQSGKTDKTNVNPERYPDHNSKTLSASKLSLVGSFTSWNSLHQDINVNLPKKETFTIEDETDSDTTSLSLTASGTSDDLTPILGRRERREGIDRRKSWSDPNSQDDEELAVGFTKSGPSQRYLPSVLDLANFNDSLPAKSTRDRNMPIPKLTFGPRNTLFSYVHLNSSEGVIICPTQNFSIGKQLNLEVLQNFNSACLSIRKILRSQMENHVEGKEKADRHSYVEHGMLFTVPNVPSSNMTNKGNIMGPLTYWVVGRMSSHNLIKNEFYVCYHDCCPQTTIEMAFQLAFGLSK